MLENTKIDFCSVVGNSALCSNIKDSIRTFVWLIYLNR